MHNPITGLLDMNDDSTVSRYPGALRPQRANNEREYPVPTQAGALASPRAPGLESRLNDLGNVLNEIKTCIENGHVILSRIDGGFPEPKPGDSRPESKPHQPASIHTLNTLIAYASDIQAMAAQLAQRLEAVA